MQKRILSSCTSSCQVCHNNFNPPVCGGCQTGYVLSNNNCLLQAVQCKTNHCSSGSCSSTTGDCSQCFAGFIKSGDQCIRQCQTLNCSDCDKNTGVCNQCDATFGYKNNQCIECDSLNEQILQCPCKTNLGYYDKQPQNSNIFDCDLCQYPCIQCVSLNECITCHHNQLHRLDEQQNCQCQNAYYDNIGQQSCFKCSYICNKCDQYNECTECSDINRDINNYCLCKDGYYSDNQVKCLKCSNNCKKCTSLSECSECINNELLPTNNCNCQKGEYYNENLQKCLKCSIKCGSCYQNYNLCLSCNNQLENNQLVFFRHNSVKFNCNCMDGYYEDQENLKCLKCVPPCKRCYNEYQCQKNSCTNYYKRDQNCHCIDGYRDNLGYCQKK